MAVALTYAAFAFVVWVHPRGSLDLIYLLYLVAMMQTVVSAIDEGMHVWWKKAMLGAFFVGYAWLLWRHPMRPNQIAVDMWSFALVAGWSVLGWRKLVDSTWWGSGWFTRRFTGRAKRLETLNDFAVHYFGESFAELTEEQQAEVGALHRASPMGDWVKPGTGRFPKVQDERLRQEDDTLRAQVQRCMNWILSISAVTWSIAEGLRVQVSAEAIAAWAWTVAVISVTLRPAIVLWTEPGMSDAGSEMELVQREASRC